MISKRCLICNKIKSMEDQDVCCLQCEDTEIDLLMAVYAYIHLNDQDFVPPEEIVENVEPIGNIKINLTFLRSWIQKEWLEKDQFNSVRVPKPIEENIEEEGFSVTQCLKKILQRQKEHKPQYDPGILRDINAELKDNRKRIGMIFMEKKKDG